MSAGNPLVTVNIVTRNRKESLHRAIESVFAQTYRPLEVVMVDNDSRDGSPEMVEQTWPEARVIRIHENIGCEPGRNVGMANARGKYVFNLDDDGALHPEALARVVERFEQEADLAVIAGAVRPMSEDRAHLVVHLRMEVERYVASFPGGASAVRVAVLRDVGYLPDYFRQGAEPDFGLRALEKRYEILHLPGVIMYHEVSDIERNRTTIMYWEILHRLKTCYRLEPWRTCLVHGLWMSLEMFVRSIREGSILGYLRGITRFLYELPVILSHRRPVSVWAVQKRNFLAYNYVTDGRQAREFRRYGLWRTFRDRLCRRHLQLRPDGNRPPGRSVP